MSSFAAGCLRLEALSTPAACQQLANELLQALVKVTAVVHHHLEPLSVKEQPVAEIVQAVLQSPALQVRHNLSALKLLACLQAMQSLVDAITVLRRAYPTVMEERVTEAARRAFGDDALDQLEAIAVLECRLLPLSSRSHSQSNQQVSRALIVKLARFLTSLRREILQLPVGTHQLQQEPGLAESVVAILRRSTSVELLNDATSVAGSMSSKYAALGSPLSAGG